MSPSEPIRYRWIVGNTAFALLGFACAVWWAWPIYADSQYLIMAAVTIAGAAVIAIIGAVRRLGWLSVTVCGLVFVVVGGVPLAVPDASLDGVLPSIDGLRTFLVGVIGSWRQLATVATLPVGHYQALLVPAYLTFFITALLALTFTLRSRRFGFVGVVIATFASLFGAAFGSAVGTTVRVAGTVALPQATQLLLGLASFVTAISWLAWRRRYERSQRLAKFGQITRGSRAVSTLRRIAAAAVMVVVALAVGTGVAAQTSNDSRTVLRTQIRPVIDTTTWGSPLSSFRTYFTDDNYDRLLFTVSGSTGADGGRVSLAVLDSYDGYTYHVGQDADGESTDRYQLLPGSRDVDVDGETVSLTVTVEGYQGIWLPTIGDATSVRFSGNQALDNAVYVGDSTDNVVDLAQQGADSHVGVETGDTYAYHGVQVSSSDASTSLASGAQVAVTKDNYPQLIQWRDELTAAGYDLTTLGGATQAIALLTNSGYLSHSVDIQNSDGTSPMWTTAIAGTAQSSRAGHSTERIETLFRQLNQADATVPAPSKAESDAVIVAAIGDDEQFATAASLLLQSAGKQARVVVGFQPEQDGSVYGKDMRAWVQVKLADGTWADIAATPQSQRSPTQVTVTKNLQQQPAVVQPQLPTVEPPSQANPAATSEENQQADAATAGSSWFTALLRPIGIAVLLLLLILSPPLTILAMKRSRRRGRRRRSDPRAVIVGGWDELVDRLVDSGTVVSAVETRRGLARRVGSPEVLADAADWAAFSADTPSARDSAEYWGELGAELDRLWMGQKRWSKLKAALSPASLLRNVRPVRGVTKAARSRSERG